MCGITGLITSKLDYAALYSAADQMNESLMHRGPDDAGIWINDHANLALCHRRLSIHDLSPLGAQPMHSHSGRWTIVFNGEIYNFHNMADKLQAEGYVLRGSSDTEVLINAIDQWGIDAALNLSIGMFAFAAYDHKTQELILARDRIGEKPLYYSLVDEAFSFASEIKGLYESTNFQPADIDINALGSYLRYGYICAPFSIFKHVRKLTPGTYLKIDVSNPPSSLDEITAVEYWSLDALTGIPPKYNLTNIAAATSHLDRLLNKVIEEQALSDVPLGAFLSGGIDSSTVAGILQSQSERPIDTFTIGFEDTLFNEAEHAKAIAKHLGSAHHELYVSPLDALKIIPELPRIYDEPFADSSQLPMIIVSKLAKSKVTVCLSGDGGDELFCGYNRYTQTRKALTTLSKIPRPMRTLVSSAIKLIPPHQYENLYGEAKRLLGKKTSANVGTKIHKFADLMLHKEYHSSYKYLSSYWLNMDELLIHQEHEIELKTKLNFEENFLNAAMEWDQKWYLSGDNLVKTDRASMNTSLELRVPLLDTRVIDFSWSIDNVLKLKNNQSKWILREVLNKYVPTKLIDRPKMGFSVPIGSWLRTDLRDWAETLLNKSFIQNQKIFNQATLERIWQEHLSKKADHTNKIWVILIFQDWYVKNFNAKK